MDACIFGGENPCDPDEQEEALAVLEAWRGVRMPSGTFCSTAASGQETHAATALAPLRPSIKATCEALNEAAQRFLEAPDGELLSSLVEAAGLYAKKHYGSGIEWTFRHGAAIGPEDVLQAFCTRVFELLSTGRYNEHKGEFEHWLGKIWSICLRAAKREHWHYQSKVVRIEDSDEPGLGFVGLDRVDAEQSAEETGRTHKNHVNEAGARRNLIERVKARFAELNDPAAEIPADTMLMLQNIAAGMGKAEAAKQAGLNERTARRRFTQLRTKVVAA